MVITYIYAEQLKIIILGRFQNFNCMLARESPSKLSQSISLLERTTQWHFSCESEVRNICAYSSGWIQFFLVSGLWWIVEIRISEALILRDRPTSRFRETKQLPLSVCQKNCFCGSFRPSLTGTAHFLLWEVKWPDFLGSQFCSRLSARAHPDDVWRRHLWLCSHPHLWPSSPSSLAAFLRPSMNPRHFPSMLVRA